MFSRVPVGLEDVSKVPGLVAELLKRGWNDTEIKDALGDNLLRVFREVEKVSTNTHTYTSYRKYNILL